MSDPNNTVCPDFSSEIYVHLRLMHISQNPGHSDANAIAHLSNGWCVANETKKVTWQAQQARIAAEVAEDERQKKEAADLIAEKFKADQEALQQDDMKKHKAKYLPILDRDVPDQPPILASATATRKLSLGVYCELYYWTNTGLTKALNLATTTDDNILTFVMKDGMTSLVPMAATRNSRSVKPDRDLSWDNFCTAIPRIIDAM
ncbi:hypothetical protein B0H34DRAFT_615047, partial [Crassisporium funariophilum]